MSYSYTVIPIRAVTKGRPRLGRRRKAFTPASTVAFEKAIATEWAKRNLDAVPLEGPIGMRVAIGSNHIEIELWELAEGCRPKYIQGDADNYEKSIQDGLNTVAYGDDKQIHHMEVFFTKDNVEVDDGRDDPGDDPVHPIQVGGSSDPVCDDPVG